MNKSMKISLIKISKIGSWAFLVSIIGSMLNAIGNFLLAYNIGVMSKKALDMATLGDFTVQSFLINFYMFVLILIFILMGLSLNLSGGLNAEKNLVSKILNKSLFVSNTDSTKEHSSDVMALITSEVSKVNHYYFQGVSNQIVLPFISGFFALITIIYIDYRFAVFALLQGVITVLISNTLTSKTKKYYVLSRTKNQMSVKQASEMLSNELFIRQYGLEDSSLEKYQTLNIDYEQEVLKSKRIIHLVSFIQSLLTLTSMILFLILAMLLSEKGSFNFSTLMLLIPLKSTVDFMFSNVSSAYNLMISTSASAEKICDFLKKGSEDLKLYLPDISYVKSKPLLDIDSVGFKYEDELVLNDISFQVNKGEHVALVGRSGSGKSTLLKLLLGLYPDYTGSIKVMNQNIKDINLESLRQNFAYVEQSSPLFNRSIYDNIALGCLSYPNVSSTEVYNAAKKAGVHDFIMTLDDDYDTKIGESGSKLSGGQKQRIAIARALIRNSDFLLLDEITASLDYDSELTIKKSLASLHSDKTIIMAVHKLNLIEQFDKIIVFNKGVIEEIGTHDTLIKNQGLYADLYKDSKGGFDDFK